MFLFWQYAILFTVVLTIFVKYILHTIDLQSENPWENKAVYMLYTDLVLGQYCSLMPIMQYVMQYAYNRNAVVPSKGRGQLIL